jgi:hypothetical protein
MGYTANRQIPAVTFLPMGEAHWGPSDFPLFKEP